MGKKNREKGEYEGDSGKRVKGESVEREAGMGGMLR